MAPRPIRETVRFPSVACFNGELPACAWTSGDVVVEISISPTPRQRRFGTPGQSLRRGVLTGTLSLRRPGTQRTSGDQLIAELGSRAVCHGDHDVADAHPAAGGSDPADEPARSRLAEVDTADALHVGAQPLTQVDPHPLGGV